MAPISSLNIVGAYDVFEVVATTETEREVFERDLVFRAPALLAPSRLRHPVPRHRLATASTYPVGLLESEELWIRLLPLFTDILPLRPVVKTSAVGTLLAYKVAIFHSNPPFWPPVFLGANYHYTSKQNKNQVQTKNHHLRCFSFLNSLD